MELNHDDVDSLVDATVKKINFGRDSQRGGFGGRGGGRNGGSRDRNFQRRGNARRGGRDRDRDQPAGGSHGRESCPYCSFLSSAFKMKIPTDHSPCQCSHRPGAVNLLKAAREDDLDEEVPR